MLKLQAVSHNTTRLIIPASTLVLAQTLTSVKAPFQPSQVNYLKIKIMTMYM